MTLEKRVEHLEQQIAPPLPPFRIVVLEEGEPVPPAVEGECQAIVRLVAPRPSRDG